MISAAIDCRTFRIPINLQDCTVVKLDLITPLNYIHCYRAFLIMDFDRMNRLAIALEKEKAELPDENAFGEQNDKTLYNDAIAYLKTGSKPNNWEDNDLLVGCVEDFECMCSDYGVD